MTYGSRYALLTFILLKDYLVSWTLHYSPPYTFVEGHPNICHNTISNPHCRPTLSSSIIVPI